MNLSHRLVFVDPASLGDNPRNWRTHPADQSAAFEGLLAEVGWLAPILYNETTQRLLDGHMRRAKAVELRLPVVPVVIVELPAHLEAKALATLDTLGIFAGHDAAQFAELLKECDTGSAELQAQFAELSSMMGLFEGDDDGNDDDSGTDGDGDEGQDGEQEGPAPDPRAVLDVVYPSDNEWGVPRLDPRWQAEGIVFPATTWGTQGRTRRMAGTWVFYTRDDRFQALFADPSVILESGAACAIEPNYSTHEQMPAAVALWATYQKRYVARYWQSKGVRVFVDLNVSPAYRKLNLLGVPREWRAFAVRAHSGNHDSLAEEFQLAADHAGTDDLVFLVYGGGQATRDLCESRGWSWLPEHSDEKRSKSLPPLTTNQSQDTNDGQVEVSRG